MHLYICVCIYTTVYILSASYIQKHMYNLLNIYMIVPVLLAEDLKQAVIHVISSLIARKR